MFCNVLYVINVHWSINNAYRQIFYRSLTLVGNEIVDHSDAVRASPVGAAAPTASSFST